MKKLVILAIALLIIFAGFPSSYAKTYYRTFEVVEITDEGIILKDFEGGTFLVEKDPGDLQVGDVVRYDTVRNRLKKSPWQPAKIINMTDRTISLQLRSGETVEVNMQAKYSNNFMEGDQVHYNASKGQIKTSNLEELEEE